jgi:MHS family proline/betaine transporter-like MFS transporter
MNKAERKIIFPVTIGSIFEWYEVYVYLFWTPIIAKNFFDVTLTLFELIYAIFVLGVGIIARPLGGILFGYIGDRKGRRVAFLISIIAITLPSICIAIMPNFTSWAFSSLIFIAIMRFFQGIPAGGELPGALCFLAEGAIPGRRKYLCSYLFVGPQIGQTIGMLQIFFLQKYLTYQELIDWGWRISFLISGIIGMFSFFLRKRLKETKAFEHLKTDHRIELHPLKESFKHHTKDIILVLFLSIFEVMGFFILYFYMFQNSKEILGLNPTEDVVVFTILLIGIVIIMPVVGYFGEKFRSVSLFKLSAYSVIALSFPFYFSVKGHFVSLTFVLFIMLILVLSIQFSLLPSFIAELFPTRVRFTCLGFSINISEGVIGGATPFIGVFLTQITSDPVAFIWLLPISGIVFLITLRFIKNKQVLNC